VHEFREDNKQALLNVISDSITGILLFVILASNHEGREVLFRTVGRVFGGLSDTAKAFLIIASTDILLGWAAGTERSEQEDGDQSWGMPVQTLNIGLVVIAAQVPFRGRVDSGHQAASWALWLRSRGEHVLHPVRSCVCVIY
jgi:CemA family